MTFSAGHSSGFAKGDAAFVNELAKISSSVASQDLPFVLGGGHAVITHSMKKSERPAALPSSLDLEFPDWSGMDDSSRRITPEVAFRLCEQYPGLFPKRSSNSSDDTREPCMVEFIL
jgi:hypothetical protein